MEEIFTYLENFQNRVFKILPMKEAYDHGVDNHLYDYIENLIISCTGALTLYPELKMDKQMLEVLNNIAFLKTCSDIPFNKWRSIILRSTRLIGFAMEKRKPK